MNNLINNILSWPILDYNTTIGKVWFTLSGVIGLGLTFYLMWYEVKTIKKEDK